MTFVIVIHLVVHSMSGYSSPWQSKAPLSALTLSWRIEDEVLLFNVQGKTNGYLGLAFSQKGLPVDGFIGGIFDDGRVYVEDLHLDYAGNLLVFIE